jgi:hypothetical protein
MCLLYLCWRLLSSAVSRGRRRRRWQRRRHGGEGGGEALAGEGHEGGGGGLQLGAGEDDGPHAPLVHQLHHGERVRQGADPLAGEQLRLELVGDADVRQRQDDVPVDGHQVTGHVQARPWVSLSSQANYQILLITTVKIK